MPRRPTRAEQEEFEKAFGRGHSESRLAATGPFSLAGLHAVRVAREKAVKNLRNNAFHEALKLKRNAFNAKFSRKGSRTRSLGRSRGRSRGRSQTRKHRSL
jgi:hypothetical protein